MGKRLNYYKKQKERSPTNYGKMYWDGRIDELKITTQSKATEENNNGK